VEITWSPQSLEDIENIGDYIAQDSPSDAQNFITKLIDSTQRLKEFPQSGHLVEENPMFRQLICQGYRIIYYLSENEVNIITVLCPGQLTKI